jgi:hypothetical protein
MGPGPRQVLSAAVLAVLLLVALVPASAARTSKGRHKFPSCSSLSRSKLPDLAQTGRLRLQKKIGPLCEFTGHHPKHYEPTLGLEIIQYSTNVWDTAKSDAEKSAARNGSDFGEVSSDEFFVSGTYTDKGLPPCKKQDGSPGKGVSKFGPVCSPEPAANHYEAIARGNDRRAGVKVMVAAAVTGQRGDVHLSHIIELAKEVVSGKLQ